MENTSITYQIKRFDDANFKLDLGTFECDSNIEETALAKLGYFVVASEDSSVCNTACCPKGKKRCDGSCLN